VVRALVFDFDGLILDTEGPIFEAWREIYRAHGQDFLPAEWQHVIGQAAHFDPFDELERRLGRNLDRERLTIDRRVRVRELVEAQPLLPGIVEWRGEARALGIKLGIASNSSREWVLGHLDRLGIGDGWDCVRCAEEVARPKPDPDVYLAVAGCLGVEPEEGVAIEDSPHGVVAAKAAGLYCIAVPNPMTADLDFTGADIRLGSLDELPLTKLVQRLGGAPLI
jgi:HAD superfamily hydrolase (TIGR01509 family)